MDPGAEARWQAAWQAAGLPRAVRRAGQGKFYAIVAYPGASGFLHLGHLRGLTYADELHRFHRMLGEAVFFPTGTHASGLPAVTFAQKVKEREPSTLRQLRERGVEGPALSALEDPARAARFLGDGYLEEFRRLGFLIDETAYLTTIDDDYRAFIRWQFHRLGELGALVQKDHFASVCPVCGPVSVDPTETDLQSGGDADWVEYTTVPFSLPDGRILLAATLRPETVYGVSNLWIHPSEPLVVWHQSEHSFLVSRRGAERLVEQHGGRIGHSVAPASLAGQHASVPVAGQQVPVLTGRIVDPERGTGVVMSVPAHAPADWLAFSELPEPVRRGVPAPPVIIDVADPTGLPASERALLAGDGVPAERAARATGARSLADREALEEATERLYRLELLRGRLRPELDGGRSVAEGRERARAELARRPGGGLLFEFSVPVICRNGHRVGIRRIPRQWFLRYSEPGWKEQTRAYAAQMVVRPEEYRRELPGIVEWFDDRPCTRQGRWLGSPFPEDPDWVIEPIADSTFYPAYFVVRRYVASGQLGIAQLTDALFDHVFLGRGDGEPTVDPALRRELREEFEYWYPLDLNIGGKEHKRVHFPVFLFTHCLLLPPERRPRGLFVHWWLTAPGGQKVSKKDVGSKGGAIPAIRGALERWGADALRLYYATVASPGQDVEWDAAFVDSARGRLEEIERLLRQCREVGSAQAPELEAWLADATHDAVARARKSFEEYAIREAAEVIYVRLPAIVRRYLQRGGGPGPALALVADAWVRMLSPITPHLAEELGAGPAGVLVAAQRFPEPSDFALAPQARAREEFLEHVEDDLRNVLKVAEGRGGSPDGVAFYVAAPWKRTVDQWVREAIPATPRGSPVASVIARAKLHGELAAYLGAIPAYVQRVAALLRSEPEAAAIDEAATLRQAEGYLVRRFGFRFIDVHSEDEPAAAESDPGSRRDRARPGRPAFAFLGSVASTARRNAGLEPRR